jgi:hypothetical protein
MAKNGTSHPDDTATLHRTARIVIEQGRATVERTKALIERARRFIASLKEKPDGN